MKQKILMLKGLPASGKSTYAKKLIDEHPNQYMRVNKDDLRAMINNGKFSRSNEQIILSIRDNIIELGLQNGKSVIVDDTNLDPKHEIRLRELAISHNAEFNIKFFNIDVRDCIRYDEQRANRVGKKVILDMYNRYLRQTPPVYNPPENGIPAVIFDIDGTLAHFTARDPHDYENVHSDVIDEFVLSILNDCRDKNYKIIIMSGRKNSCYNATVQWLHDNNVNYDLMFMREANDNRKDAIIKKEIFDKYIKDYYDIHCVYDDRNQVVDMWRSLGLRCLQVADGNF